MNNKLLSIPLVVLAIAFGYFFFQSKSCGASCTVQSVDVTAVAFNELTNNSDSIVLDVRTPEEYNSGHIAGAINVDFNNQSEFQSSIDKLDKNKTYLVYCRSGNRSDQAVSLMQAKGFTNLVNLTGGIQSWQSANYSLSNN